MNEVEQKNGERRVRDLLIEPLKRRGLGRPSQQTKVAFEASMDDLSQRLAYMSADRLCALEEFVASHPGGKQGDRFPIANKILSEAARIQPPEAGVSPLVRAIFKAEIGRLALTEGWAPELLAEVRRTRRWPAGNFTVSQIKQQADDAIRRLRDIEFRQGRGDQLTREDSAWRAHRLAACQSCRDIAALSEVDA